MYRISVFVWWGDTLNIMKVRRFILVIAPIFFTPIEWIFFSHKVCCWIGGGGGKTNNEQEIYNQAHSDSPSHIFTRGLTFCLQQCRYKTDNFFTVRYSLSYTHIKWGNKEVIQKGTHEKYKHKKRICKWQNLYTSFYDFTNDNHSY